MLNDYKFKGPTQKLEIQVEETVAEILQKMEKHVQIPVSELVNTALKRFISQHKDFYPASSSKK